mmetsp:Transcript_36577/g.103291  ORF Transcript_36577/g.103291 Transcript_36577/m.103291 type:complete len:206 (-) Transcript_36577:1219-1836(-)
MPSRASQFCPTMAVGFSSGGDWLQKVPGWPASRTALHNACSTRAATPSRSTRRASTATSMRAASCRRTSTTATTPPSGPSARSFTGGQLLTEPIHAESLNNCKVECETRPSECGAVIYQPASLSCSLQASCRIRLFLPLQQNFSSIIWETATGEWTEHPGTSCEGKGTKLTSVTEIDSLEAFKIECELTQGASPTPTAWTALTAC